MFNNIIRWFVENKSFSSLMMVLIISSAFILTPKLNKKIFPDTQLQGFIVQSVYPGASSSQIEQQICQPIENIIKIQQHIWKVTSTISNHACKITVLINKRSATKHIVSQVNTALKGVTFPKQASQPLAQQIVLQDYVARLIIYGDTQHANLYNTSKLVINDLNNIGIWDINYEVPINLNTLIEISRPNLEKYNISISQIAEKIKQFNTRIASGSIESSTGEILINSVNTQTQTLSDIVLGSNESGAVLKLGDIASFKTHQLTTHRTTYYDRFPSINLVINQGENSDLAQLSNQLQTYISNKKLPNGLNLDIDGDASIFFNARINMLIENALFGLVLVFFTLILFLNGRLALWVTLGIPISFAGTLSLMFFLDQSLNMISTFAFLLVLGIIVDDAIVVAESIYSKQTKYLKGQEGAISGATAVAKPVIYAVITTILMFSPLLFIPGTDGDLIRPIPVVVITALLLSLVECFLILPAHLSYQSHPTLQTVAQKSPSVIGPYIKEGYQKLLSALLGWRYSILALFCIIFMVTIALMNSGRIKVTLFSTVESDEAFATLELPYNTPFKTTSLAIAQIEDAALELQGELFNAYGAHQIQHIRSYPAAFGDHSAMIHLTFPSRNERFLSTEEVAKLWKEKVGIIPGVEKLEFDASFNRPGPSINIQLSSSNHQQLYEATQELQRYLSEYPACYGIQNNIKQTSIEVDVALKESASKYSLNLEHIVATVREAFNGIKIVAPDSYPETLLIRLPANERNSLWHLEQLRIPTMKGQWVPLHHIATLRFKRVESEITRYNFQRSINVQSFVDSSKNSSSQVMENLTQRFLSKLPIYYPDVSWQPAGSLEMKENTQQTLFIGFLVAMIIMIILLTSLFKSIILTFIVLSAIPFGFIGAILGHGIFNMDITIWSIAGMIAVSGIVVNDNVVLISCINSKKHADLSLLQAIVRGSSERFRPIFLTTLTTIMGLLPIMFENSWEAQFIIPMVISIGFGVLFATLISLILVPCLYLIYNDCIVQRPYTHKLNS
jgi:multidrug efflux pump subunit AcrB